MKTEMAHDRIADKGRVEAGRVWREGWLTVPGISAALLPKLACPLCWPFYSAIVSSVGLGFLISTKYLLTFTVAFLILTFGALAYHAKQRRGYGPLMLGMAGAVAVVIGKFDLESNPVTFTGIAVLVAASAWNMWPLSAVESCSCKSENGNVTTQVLRRDPPLASSPCSAPDRLELAIRRRPRD